MVARNVSYTYDNALLLKDAGLIAADAAGTVSAAAKVINVGAGRFEGTVVVEVTVIEVATDERYIIAIQGCDAAAFSSGIENLACLELGWTTARAGGAATSTVGRYYIRFSNEQNGVIYPYIRLYTDVAGTIASGANFSAYIAKE